MRLGPIIRRLAGSVVAIFLGSIVVFVIFFVMPGGDPAARIAGRTATPELIAAVRHSYGFDRPLYLQYLAMMHKLVTNQLESYATHTMVVSQIFSRFPATLSVAIGATVIGAALTIVSGMIGAIYRGRVPAAAVTALSMVIVSVPVIYVIAELQQQVSGRWSVIPVGGYVGFNTNLAGWFQHMILPWTVLSLAIFAVSGRLLTANLIDALTHPYVKTARAKGASWRRIWLKHVLPNAILPIVTTLSLEFAGLIGGGAILVESLCDISGDGQYAAEALLTLDLPVLIGLTLVGSVVVITVNATVDILYPLIDPRSRSAL
jgi:peptide/nickel transport system permease protein